jgi:hypothetical protein
VGTNPDVILNEDRCGLWRSLTLFSAILIPIDDTQVMTKQTIVPDTDFFIRRNRGAVIDESVIAY